MLFDIIDAGDEAHQECVVVVAVDSVVDYEVHDSLPKLRISGVGDCAGNGFPVDVL